MGRPDINKAPARKWSPQQSDFMYEPFKTWSTELAAVSGPVTPAGELCWQQRPSVRLGAASEVGSSNLHTAAAHSGWLLAAQEHMCTRLPEQLTQLQHSSVATGAPAGPPGSGAIQSSQPGVVFDQVLQVCC